MITDPYAPEPPAVDHPVQTKLAAQIEAMNAAASAVRSVLNWKPDPGKHTRAGITKNKMQPRDKSRVRMAKESRKRNRGR